MGAEVLLAIGTATAVAGTGYSVYSGQQAASQSREAEALRQRQLNIDSARRQRELARKLQLSRAVALSNSVSGGSQYGSGLQGGYGEIQQRSSEDSNYNTQSTDIGNRLFDVNARMATYQANAQAGSSVAGLGTSLMQNAGTISRIGTDLFGGSSSGPSSTSAGYRGPYSAMPSIY